MPRRSAWPSRKLTGLCSTRTSARPRANELGDRAGLVLRAVVDDQQLEPIVGCATTGGTRRGWSTSASTTALRCTRGRRARAAGAALRSARRRRRRHGSGSGQAQPGCGVVERGRSDARLGRAGLGCRAGAIDVAFGEAAAGVQPAGMAADRAHLETVGEARQAAPHDPSLDRPGASPSPGRSAARRRRRHRGSRAGGAGCSAPPRRGGRSAARRRSSARPGPRSDRPGRGRS